MPRLRAALIWAAVAAAALIPLALAATSPLLAWREPVYIAAGFAGVAALALLLFQPLLARGYMPGLPAPRGRALHRWVGAGIVAAIVAHVGGLWLTSPPDVIDALLLRSPTPFSLWGVLSMWAVIATALLALFRRKLRPALWRLAHLALAALIVAGAAAHALLIEGTMETISKVILSAFVLAVAAKAIADLRPWIAITGRKT